MWIRGWVSSCRGGWWIWIGGIRYREEEKEGGLGRVGKNGCAIVPFVRGRGWVCGEIIVGGWRLSELNGVGFSDSLCVYGRW